MKHLGDICKIVGTEIEPVWCITGGSPCQDLSIAGKRAGLAGARSGLFMEQVRIVKEMREVDKRNGRTGDMVRPRFMVWENVSGAFSSNKGRDFAAVLEEIIRIEEKKMLLAMYRKRALDELATYSMLAKAMQVPGQMTVEELLERARGV